MSKFAPKPQEPTQSTEATQTTIERATATPAPATLARETQPQAIQEAISRTEQSSKEKAVIAVQHQVQQDNGKTNIEQSEHLRQAANAAIEGRPPAEVSAHLSQAYPQKEWTPAETNQFIEMAQKTYQKTYALSCIDEYLKHARQGDPNARVFLHEAKLATRKEAEVGPKKTDEEVRKETERLETERTSYLLSKAKSPEEKEAALRAALDVGFSFTAVVAAATAEGIHDDPSLTLQESGMDGNVMQMLQFYEGQKASMAMQDVVRSTTDRQLSDEQKKELRERATRDLAIALGSEKRAQKTVGHIEEAAKKGDDAVRKAIDEQIAHARAVIKLHSQGVEGVVPKTEGPITRAA